MQRIFIILFFELVTSLIARAQNMHVSYFSESNKVSSNAIKHVL